MYIPKRYGESKLEPCPFCGKQAIVRNKQKIPVCQAHRDAVLDDLKCACGNYLETKVGKFGLYSSCPKCGNVNPKRAIEMNQPKAVSKPQPFSQPSAAHSPAQPEKKAQRETIINPDDPNYFS
jgi:hypothetical protein